MKYALTYDYLASPYKIRTLYLSMYLFFLIVNNIFEKMFSLEYKLVYLRNNIKTYNENLNRYSQRAIRFK